VTRTVPQEEASAPSSPDRPSLRQRVATRWAAIPSTDLEVLGLWLLTRAATLIVVAAGGWLFVDEAVVPFLQRWEQWDVPHLVAVASSGYGTQPTGVPLEAFFPGLPLLLRALHTIGIDYLAAGLLISFVAGAIAVVALGRLGDLDGGAGVGRRAVLFMLLSPGAVFLAAGYTEALFLAFAIPAWLAARRERWLVAGLLAAGACSVRVSGIFLVAGLVVHYAVGDGGIRRRGLRGAPALLLPAVPLGLFMLHLQARTGNWLAWQVAQEEGWSRRLTDPWTALTTTWDGAFDPAQPPLWQWTWRYEIVVVFLSLAFTGWLLWRRRWGESTYVGLTLVALATSSWYFSVPRATLLWWPLWIALATWSMRARWVLIGWLTIAAPMAVVFTLLFTTGRWAG
jgi:Mannosyltransferase (PIG-V)